MSAAVYFDWERVNHALVVGAGHGIGFALVEKLLQATTARIFATYRQPASASELLNVAKANSRVTAFRADPTNETDLSTVFSELSAHTSSVDLVLNSVGLLQAGQLQPEKSLEAIDGDRLMHYFLVNSVVTPLLAKHAIPFLRGPSISLFATISARVGSIEDNRLGGWYGYRASKAALNMFLKTISVEYATKRNNCLVLALHPGTTRTALAKPFIARTRYIVHEPDATAAHLFSVIEGKSMAETGQFYAWDGEPIPW